MARQNNKNWKGSYKKKFNKPPKKKEHYLDKFNTTVEVRNGDINGAIRKLKKILENDNRQKELSKREFYEKPSAKRKRKKDAAKKRTQREMDKRIFSGEMPLQEPSVFSFMKYKRKRRKYSDKKAIIARVRRQQNGWL